MLCTYLYLNKKKSKFADKDGIKNSKYGALALSIVGLPCGWSVWILQNNTETGKVHRAREITKRKKVPYTENLKRLSWLHFLKIM